MKTTILGIIIVIFCMMNKISANACTNVNSGYVACSNSSDSSIANCPFRFGIYDYCCPPMKSECYCADNGAVSCRMAAPLKGGSIFMVVFGSFVLLACLPCTIIFVVLLGFTTPLFFIAWPIILIVCFPISCSLALMIAGATILNDYNSSEFASAVRNS